MISKLLGWISNTILSNGDRRTYSEDGRWWVSGNGFGVNTEHPDYLKGMQNSIIKFDKVFNKGKYMRNLHLDRSNESVAEHLNNFTQWATDRQIIQNANILAQGLKLVSEVGELADNLAKGRCTKDDIGDCLVVLNNLALMQGLTVEECMAHAWEDIKDRKGYMNIHGVFIKDGDTDGK